MGEARSTHGRDDKGVQIWSEDLQVYEKIILKWIVGKESGNLTGFIWLRTRTSGGFL